MPKYVSCIRFEGKPILPPVLNDEKRLLMRKLRDEAVLLETRLKEKQKTQLMDQVRTILDQCVTTVHHPQVSRMQPFKHSHLNKTTVARTNNSLNEPVEQWARAKSFSLPSTPVFDESSLAQLHRTFLAMKEELKDVSISGTSAVSTDLGPYMAEEDSDSCCSDSSTPRVVSDTDDVSSLDCSTPLKSPRVRRLSYTLEAPSPVLLKHLMNKATEQDEILRHNSIPVPKLNLSKLDDSSKNRSQNLSEERNGSTLKNINEVSNTPKISPKNPDNGRNGGKYIGENSPTQNGKGTVTLTDDLSNGNCKAQNKNIKDDDNGNVIPAQSAKSVNLIEEFLMQQQQLMKELLDQQAQEQERLVNLFKEQEQQLVIQLQVQQSAQQPSTGRKSPACRNLNQSFDRSARVKPLFDSGRLSALIRGYLTRRLIATDRVQEIIQTIRDTTTCLKELNQGSLTILPSDVDLHRRLLQQLNGAIHSFHEIFFDWNVGERMLVIRRDREKKGLMIIAAGMPIRMRPRSRSLSSATQKSMERKLTRSVQDSSRPSSASTILPRTSPSSQASSNTKRSPSSLSSFSSHSNSVSQSNGSSTWKKQPVVKGRKPWRC